MRVRAQVRDAQRAIAPLDANYHHVANRLEQVLARRADVLVEQHRWVAAARGRTGEGAPA